MRRRDLLLAGSTWLALAGSAKARPGFGRSLSLKNANTGESFVGRYRDASGPVPGAIADLAELLRDHHSDTVGPLDLPLIDLLADVMDAIGQPTATILSAYRTPATNARLASTTFGVAEKSQHMYGRAVDIYFEHRLADAEKAARGMRRGGVGWYPDSHFVHIDTGPVRHWELRSGNFRTMLASAHPLGSPLVEEPTHGIGPSRTLADRQAIHRTLARQEFIARNRSK
jgi:uncharacterized protein YcbK (DUF882 family)